MTPPDLRTLSLAGRAVPSFVYGTAWKEEETERLTGQALLAGFRAIDTANQRRHYHEAGVGAALGRALGSGLCTREQLFVQTKFTSRSGQDHRLPYDEAADPTTQVRQSFASSLAHLGLETIDSYVLHGPSTRGALGAFDLEVWRAMEALAAEGRARALGVSNVTLAQLEQLCAKAQRPPAVVQNRCYARTGWDREVRAFCRARGIVYQGFSLLTANAEELRRPALLRLVERVGATAAQLVFRFALEVGMQPLTGTSDEAHLREDLAAYDLSLPGDAVDQLERLGDPVGGR